jgi:YHS domain-containing protein
MEERMKRIFVSLSIVVMVLAVGVAIAGENHAEYDGYCPVAYSVMNKSVKGDAKISSDFAGKHFVFANADAKKMFEADPSKYAVAYDGYCATAVSMGKKLDSDPTIFENVDGVTYLFSSAEAKEMFDGKQEMTIAKGHEQWAKINPAFGGYCPVAYVEMNKPVHGQERIATDYHGAHILFANGDAEKMFKANPKKYSVAYSGYCATAMSMGKKFDSDPTIFENVDGVTYLFSSEKAKMMFEKDHNGVVKKANTQWAKLN